MRCVSLACQGGVKGGTAQYKPVGDISQGAISKAAGDKVSQGYNAEEAGRGKSHWQPTK